MTYRAKYLAKYYTTDLPDKTEEIADRLEAADFADNVEYKLKVGRIKSEEFLKELKLKMYVNQL